MHTDLAIKKQRLGDIIDSVYTGICNVHIAQILFVILAVLGGIDCTEPEVCQKDCRTSSWPSQCYNTAMLRCLVAWFLGLMQVLDHVQVSNVSLPLFPKDAGRLPMLGPCWARPGHVVFAKSNWRCLGCSVL